ncbi:MAG: hypothetical protein NC548_52755 [Lachnospiraceae bacterium]|nr:hypothetical protein [Lachnospiraceae bacterium]
MIAKGRNDLQMHIDEYAIVLERLLFEVPKQIKSSFSELKKEIEGTAVSLPPEEAYTIKSSLTEAYRMDDEAEMIESFYKSMVIMICSYCETTLLSMLPTDIQEQYKNKGRKIDIYYKTIQRYYGVKLQPIKKVWRDKCDFVKFRNDITHGKEYDNTPLTSEYINSNLKMAKHLLKTTADIISRHPNFINHY